MRPTPGGVEHSHRFAEFFAQLVSLRVKSDGHCGLGLDFFDLDVGHVRSAALDHDSLLQECGGKE
jgi:hypothetical protein